MPRRLTSTLRICWLSCWSGYGSFEVDTAVVVLLDASSRDLIATAASGIEAEVRQGVHIPVGEGFAGRIAADKKTVILEQVDHNTVVNPLLRERGIRSLLGVPLLSSGRVIGVLHVGTLGARRGTVAWTDDGLGQGGRMRRRPGQVAPPRSGFAGFPVSA